MSISRTAIELSEVRKDEINKAQKVTGMSGGVIIGSLFGMFLNETSRAFLETTLKSVLFPVVMLMDVIQAILAWREAQLAGFKKGLVGKAILETVAAAAISVAVIGGFVAAALFASAAPIIFTAVMGTKTLYHAGASIYHFNKYRSEEIPEQKSSLGNTAAQHFVATIALTLTTVSIGLVMLAGKFAFAALGVAASVGMIGYGVITAIVKYRKEKAQNKAYERIVAAESDLGPDIEIQHGNTAGIYKGIKAKPEEQPQAPAIRSVTPPPSADTRSFEDDDVIEIYTPPSPKQL